MNLWRIVCFVRGHTLAPDEAAHRGRFPVLVGDPVRCFRCGYRMTLVEPVSAAQLNSEIRENLDYLRRFSDTLRTSK